MSRPTVAADLVNAGSDIETVTNSRGQQRPATYTRTAPAEPNGSDAEIVEDGDRINTVTR